MRKNKQTLKCSITSNHPVRQSNPENKETCHRIPWKTQHPSPVKTPLIPWNHPPPVPQKNRNQPKKQRTLVAKPAALRNRRTKQSRMIPKTIPKRPNPIKSKELPNHQRLAKSNQLPWTEFRLRSNARLRVNEPTEKFKWLSKLFNSTRCLRMKSSIDRVLFSAVIIYTHANAHALQHEALNLALGVFV